MRTVVHFVGAEKPLTLVENYDKVTAELIGNEAGQFNCPYGDEQLRVTIYRSNIAYVEETSEAEPSVAFA